MKKKKKTYIKVSRKEKRIKYGKYRLFGIIAGMVALFFILIYYLYMYLPYESVDLTEVFEVSFSGYDTNGSATCVMKEEEVDRILSVVRDHYESEKFHIHETNPEDYLMFRESLIASLSKTEYLSNGDSVLFACNYDKELADQLKIKITGNTKTYEITDLPEVTVISKYDVFDNLDVKFEGISPNLELKMTVKDEHPEYSNIQYEVQNPKDGYAAGDQVSIRAVYEQEDCIAAKYVVDMDSEECIMDYNVEGDAYLNDAKLISKDLILEASKAAQKLFTEETAQEYGVRIFTEAGLVPKYKNKETTFYFGDTVLSSAVFKSLFPEVEKEQGMSYNDLDLIFVVPLRQAIDEQACSAYIAVRFSDLIEKTDGTVKCDFSDPLILTASNQNTRVLKNVVDAYINNYDEVKVYPEY